MVIIAYPRRLRILGLCILFVGSVLYLSRSPLFQKPASANGTNIPSKQSSAKWTMRLSPPEHELVPDQESTKLSENIELPLSFGPPERPSPKITILAVWNPKEQSPKYLPHFFASVAANSAHFDLLFVVYDRYQVGCVEARVPQGIPNVKEVCMSWEEYWELHRSFLCEKWHCNEEERVEVLRLLHERRHGDLVNENFRPFRADIFAKYIDPRTPIWGWCDMDVMFGDFGRVFPWDVAHDFDVLLPAPSGDFHDIIMLYFVGHLGFLRRSPQVTDAFMRMPQLQSFRAFKHLPYFEMSTLECDYSHLLLKRLPELTFIRFPAMIHGRMHVETVGGGVHWLWSDEQWEGVEIALLEPGSAGESARRELSKAVADARSEEARPTISAAGHEYEIELREGMWDRHLWCDKADAVDFIVDQAQARLPGGGISRRIVYRRDPYGPVYDRVEPMGMTAFGSDVLTGQSGAALGASELLYTHFQAEKYSDWWDMPGHTLRPGEVLYVDKDRGAWAWIQDGQMTFEAGHHERRL